MSLRRTTWPAAAERSSQASSGLAYGVDGGDESCDGPFELLRLDPPPWPYWHQLPIAHRGDCGELDFKFACNNIIKNHRF